MALRLSFHPRTHKNSSIPFKKLLQSPQTPLFRVKPIQACSFSPLHLKPRSTNPWGFNVSYSEALNINSGCGGGGGGGVKDVKKDGGGDGSGGGNIGICYKVVKMFFRVSKWILDNERSPMVELVDFMVTLTSLCIAVTFLLFCAMLDIMSNGSIKWYEVCFSLGGFACLVLVSTVVGVFNAFHN